MAGSHDPVHNAPQDASNFPSESFLTSNGKERSFRRRRRIFVLQIPRVLVVPALSKEQDEDRPVEFFPSPPFFLFLLRPPFFPSPGEIRCTQLCSVSLCPVAPSSIACSSDHGTLQTIFPDFSYVPLPLLPSFFVPFVRLPGSRPPRSPSPSPFVFLCEQAWRRDGKFPMKTENSWLCAIGFQR